MKLLLLGATGLVGSEVLQLALSHPAFSEVIAPTRKPLAHAGKLVNPVGPCLEELLPLSLSRQPDAVICALGTTQAKAGSKAAFRHADYALPLAWATAAAALGVPAFVVVSAMGAAPGARSFYYRTKGELEAAVQGLGFASLTICRPSLIDGARDEARAAEGMALAVLLFLAPVLPRRLHVNPAHAIAAKLIDAAIASAPGQRWIGARDMT